MKNWQAPVSLALVLLNEQDYGCVIKKLDQYLRKAPEIAKHLRVHLLFPTRWNEACEKPVTKLKCGPVQYSSDDVVTYPANVARNTARMVNLDSTFRRNKTFSVYYNEICANS